MELRQLRYFVVLAEVLNYTRAAQSLFVSQPALSQSIKDLERELGVTLFNRTRKNVELTVEGSKLYDEAKAIIEKVELLPCAFSGKLEDSCSLTIGFDHRVMAYQHLQDTVCDYVSELSTCCQGIRVHYKTGEYEEISRELESGTVDLLFMMSQKPCSARPGQECECLFEDRLSLIVRSDDLPDRGKKQLCDFLRHHEIVLLENESRIMYQAMSIFNDLDVEPHYHFVPDRSRMLLNIKSGNQVGILPGGMTYLAGPETRIVPLRGDLARIYVLAAYGKKELHPCIVSLIGKLKATDFGLPDVLPEGDEE